MDDERTTKMTDMDIKDVLQSLAKQGFVKITLEYSGGSDDGYFEAPMFFVEDKKTKRQEKKASFGKIMENEAIGYAPAYV